MPKSWKDLFVAEMDRASVHMQAAMECYEKSDPEYEAIPHIKTARRHLKVAEAILKLEDGDK